MFVTYNFFYRMLKKSLRDLIKMYKILKYSHIFRKMFLNIQKIFTLLIICPWHLWKTLYNVQKYLHSFEIIFCIIQENVQRIFKKMYLKKIQNMYLKMFKVYKKQCSAYTWKMFNVYKNILYMYEKFMTCIEKIDMYLKRKF